MINGYAIEIDSLKTKIETVEKTTTEQKKLLRWLLEFFKGSWLHKSSSDEDIKKLEEIIKASKEV